MTRLGAVFDVELPLTATFEAAGHAEKLGYESVWLAHMPNQRDTTVVMGALAGVTRQVPLGLGIVPIYQRPPVVLAQTALTLDELSGHRLVLGLGLGLRGIGEWMVGVAVAPPVESMREYLTIVRALVRDGEVSYTGRWHSGHATYTGPRREGGLPIHVGAFGPRMLELAGELADGVILWMCTPGYLRDHALPRLRAGWARRKDGQRDFPVTVMAQALATPEPARARDLFRQRLTGYLREAHYRRLFTTCGFAAEARARQASEGMADGLAAIGEPQKIRDRIAAYHEAGASEVLLVQLPSGRRDICHDTLEAARGQ